MRRKLVKFQRISPSTKILQSKPYLYSYRKKDRRIRELEKMKSSNKPNNNDNDITNKPGFNNPKHLQNNFIQENPEEKNDAMNLLLKSKLKEVTNEKEKLEQQNKELEEQVKNLEFKLQQGGGGFKESKKKIAEPVKAITNIQESNQNGKKAY